MMLNIQNRISLSKNSKIEIKKFRKRKGALTVKAWDQISKSVKNEISKKLFYNQKFKCVYCSRDLASLSPQIDHFADKARYSDYSFCMTNLFYSCGPCNSTSFKGSKNTISVYSAKYHHTQFRIVHPYFDDPRSEIRFKDPENIYLDVNMCTYKGKKTIVFFKYHEKRMTFIRSKQLVFERLSPIQDGEMRELILESIAYK